MLKAVLFDAFQTLIFLRPSYAGAFAEVCVDFGHAIGVADVERILPQIDDLVYGIAKGLRGDYSCTPEELHERWIEYNRQIFEAVGATGDPVAMADESARMADEMERRFNSGAYTLSYDDAKETLINLRGHGLRLGIVSNGTPGVEKCLELLGYAELVDFILISALVGWEKPSPNIFNLALEQAGIKPEEAVFVGDHYEADILGARNVGMRAIQICRDGQPPGPDVKVITNLTELWPLLNSPSRL